MTSSSSETERYEQTPQGTARTAPEATDLSKNDARAEALEGDAAEQSPEFQEAVADVSDKALELTDILAALRPDTNVENSEVNGDFAEVAKTDFGDGASVEHVTTGDGESTLIHLSLDAADSSTGATSETVTIKHNLSQIMIGDQLITNIADVNRVRQVIAQLRQEASELPTTEKAAELNAEMTPEAETTEAAEQTEDSAAPEITTPEDAEAAAAEALAQALSLATPTDTEMIAKEIEQLSPEDRQKQYAQALNSADRLAA